MTHIFGIFIKTGVNKFFELLGVVAGELRRIVLRYEEENSHWVEVAVGGLPFS